MRERERERGESARASAQKARIVITRALFTYRRTSISMTSRLERMPIGTGGLHVVYECVRVRCAHEGMRMRELPGEFIKLKSQRCINIK